MERSNGIRPEDVEEANIPVWIGWEDYTGRWRTEGKPFLSSNWLTDVSGRFGPVFGTRSHVGRRQHSYDEIMYGNLNTDTLMSPLDED